MRTSAVLAALAVLVTACSSPGTVTPTAGSKATAPAPGSATPIKLSMGYIANIQFAPFYVAAAKGYYRSAGLDVTFNYIFEDQGVKLAASGEEPFAIVSGEQVPLARANGLAITYVMAWYQKYPIAVIAKAGAGIKAPADLKGKTVGIPGTFGASYVGWRGLLQKAGLKESDLTVQDIGFTQVAALSGDKVNAVVGYVNNEPLQLQAAGMAVDVIRVSDTVNLVANGLVVSDKTIAEKPDLVKRLVQATLHGLADAIANPEEAFALSKSYVADLSGPQEAVQKQVLQTSVELWRAPKLGAVDPAAWDSTQDVLVNMGLLQKKLDTAQLYTDQFLNP